MTTAGPRPRSVKPLTRRWWFWAALVLVALVATAMVAGRGGGGETTVGPIASTPVAPSTASAPPAAPTPTPQDDPMSDGGWILSDVQADPSQFGTAFTGRVTNTEDQTRTGLFTLTVFSDGQRIYQTSGSANDVEPHQTATVTFVGATEDLPGDPAGWTYEFQSDL